MRKLIFGKIVLLVVGVAIALIGSGCPILPTHLVITVLNKISGAPLNSAVVSIPPGEYVLTDAENGAYPFFLDGGRYTVLVEAEGFEELGFTVELGTGEQQSVTARLAPEGEGEGHVEVEGEGEGEGEGETPGGGCFECPLFGKSGISPSKVISDWFVLGLALGGMMLMGNQRKR